MPIGTGAAGVSTAESDHCIDPGNCILGARCFLNPPCVLEDLNASLLQYQCETRHVDLLDDKERQSICDLLSSNKSETVSIGRYEPDDYDAKWTTDITLEIIAMVTEDEAVLAHFCDRHEGEDKQVETMIHSLLAQLCDYHQHTINHDICHQWHQPEHSDKHWELFEQRIAKSGLKHVVIMLDNVDAIYSNEKGAFLIFIENLVSFSQTTTVTVKLLITSRLPVVTDCLRERMGGSYIVLDNDQGERIEEIW